MELSCGGVGDFLGLFGVVCNISPEAFLVVF